MYVFIKAVLKPKGKNQRFQSVDLTDMYLQTLFDNYHAGYIELSNPTLTLPVFIDIQALKQMNMLNYSNVKFPTWLSRQGSKSILGASDEPTVLTNHITFSDAIQAGCTLTRVHPSDIHQLNEYAVSDLTDLHLVKTLQAKPYLQNYTLTTVAGRCHVNIPTDSGILVKGAGQTLAVSGNANVGLISFESIGKINQVRFDPANLDSQTAPLKQGFTYHTKLDLTKQTVIVSLLGKLFYPNDVVRQIDDTDAIHIHLERVDLIRLITESVDKLDLTSLGLNIADYQAHGVAQSLLVSDEMIKLILSHMQSFMVIVDSEDLKVEQVALGQTGLVGVYELTVERNLPFIDDHGNLTAQWMQVYEGQFVNIHRHYVEPTLYTEPADQGEGFVDLDRYTKAQTQVDLYPQQHTGYQLDIFTEKLI